MTHVTHYEQVAVVLTSPSSSVMHGSPFRPSGGCFTPGRADPYRIILSMEAVTRADEQRLSRNVDRTVRTEQSQSV